ncbi:MAG: hypothetical protein PVI23_06185, partial [Maricaulaceae bacterium]
MSKAETKPTDLRVPDAADIEAAVRRLAAAHEPTRAQLEADEEDARRREHKRMLEALLFASDKPLGVETLR